jgi:hypothetical protein
MTDVFHIGSSGFCFFQPLKKANQVKKAIEEELIVYGRLQMPLQFDAGPLKFWHMHSCKLPYLATLAFQILGIPASTSQVERLFSAAGRAIGRRRPRLSAKRGAQIIYGHANVTRGITGRAFHEQRLSKSGES